MGEAARKTAKIRCGLRISLQFHGRVALAMAWHSLYGAARFGDIVVISQLRPTASGWAVIFLSVAVLSLGGCGRKGALDLPPNGGPQASAPAVNESEARAANQSGNALFNSNVDSAPVAGKGSKKSFILDPLLDERRQ
jgi:predicted small lipoprotein YifL